MEIVSSVTNIFHEWVQQLTYVILDISVMRICVSVTSQDDDSDNCETICRGNLGQFCSSPVSGSLCHLRLVRSIFKAWKFVLSGKLLRKISDSEKCENRERLKRIEKSRREIWRSEGIEKWGIQGEEKWRKTISMSTRSTLYVKDRPDQEDEGTRWWTGEMLRRWKLVGWPVGDVITSCSSKWWWRWWWWWQWRWWRWPWWQ